MPRISATLCEAFRRIIHTDWGNVDEFLAQVMGKPFEPNWRMKAGTAFHSLLETGKGDVPTENFPPDPDKFLKSGDYWFATEAVQFGREHIGPGLFEVKATAIWDIFGCPVEVVAKCDHILGTLIQDHKCKFGTTPHAGDYESSLQWRMYLAVHGADCFRYNLFSFFEPDAGNYCEFRDVTSFRFWRYPGMEEDCKRWVAMLLDFVHERKLTHYLDREGTSPSVPEFAEAT